MAYYIESLPWKKTVEIVEREFGITEKGKEAVSDFVTVLFGIETGAAVLEAGAAKVQKFGKDVFKHTEKPGVGGGGKIKTPKVVVSEAHDVVTKPIETPTKPAKMKVEEDNLPVKKEIEVPPLKEQEIPPKFDHLKALDSGDLDNPKVLAILKTLPDEVPIGRIDYRAKFSESLKDFQKGSSKLVNTKLKEDLYLVNYHDISKPIGDGRSIEWATHFEVGNRIPTIEELHQHIALVKPDWGPRNAVTYIKIPKGTDVTWISGKATWKESLKTGEYFRGGGYQVRFRDFDPKWVTETKPLNKP